MRILIDLDGVCCALLPAWLKIYKMLGGEHVRPEDVKTYSMKTDVKDREKLFRALGHVSYADVQPYTGMAEAITLLRAAGHTLRFVSHVPECAPTHFAEKLAWCKEHIPGFSAAELVFCSSEEKAFLEGSVLVEDYPDTIERWQAAGAFRQGVCVTQPYNLSYNADYRVASLLEFAEKLVGK